MRIFDGLVRHCDCGALSSPMTVRVSKLIALILCTIASLMLPTGRIALAQNLPHSAAPADVEYVEIDTEAGLITLALDKANAPITAGNFLRYADEDRFDGTVFYRVMRLEWGTPPNGLVQGGTQGNPKRNRQPIAHEPTSETGIKHEAGTISMARFAVGTAAGDFSIMLSPQPGLDAQPDAQDPAARPGFAAFGYVVDGMEVVRAIYDAPLSPTKGEGFLKGQMIENPIRILDVRRVSAPQPKAVPMPDTQ